MTVPKKARVSLLITAVFGVGLLVGVLIRAALVEDTSWCRNIDYGNLPQYLTIALAVVVGVLTFISVRTSQEALKTSRDSFDLDARTREFAQARLVYADIIHDDRMKPRETLTVPVKEKPGYEVIYATTGPPMQITVQEAHQGSSWQIETHPDQSLRVVVLAVNNNSDEVISQSQVSVNQTDGTPVLEGSLGIVAPRSKGYRIFVTDQNDLDAKYTQVTFLDSTGVWWTREGGHPVRKVAPD